MKKTIILLLPLFIGCSFQVKDTVNEEERLSRRFILEDETYGEFNFDKGFTPHEYELEVKDYEVENIERSPRELTLFDEEEEFKVNESKNFNEEDYYRSESPSYQWNDELKILEKNTEEIDYKYE